MKRPKTEKNATTAIFQKLESNLTDALKKQCKTMKVTYSDSLMAAVVEKLLGNIGDKVTPEVVAQAASVQLTAEYEKARLKLEKDFEARMKKIGASEVPK